jgi:hypothetical protein
MKSLAQLFGGLGERLDRHLAADRLVHAPVNHTHAANAQDAQDLVFADLSDWCTGIHGQTPDSIGFQGGRRKSLKRIRAGRRISSSSYSALCSLYA